jgi:hypothetical protein
MGATALERGKKSGATLLRSMSPPTRLALRSLLLLSCTQSTTSTIAHLDAAPSEHRDAHEPAPDRTTPTDAGMQPSDGRGAACDSAQISAKEPYLFDRDREFNFGELFEVAIAATGNGRVGIIIGKPAVEYIESLDGGASFRPSVPVTAPGLLNLRFAMGHGFAIVTYADVTEHKGLMLQRAALAPGGVTGFPPATIIAGPEAYVGDVVFGPGQQLAILASNSSASEGFYASFSENAGATISPQVLVDRYAVTGPGVFAGDGRLYTFYYYNNSTPNWLIHARVSSPPGAKFTAAVTKQIEGLVDESRGTFAFETRGGEIAFMKPHAMPLADRVALVIDRFVPSTSAWGRSTTAFEGGKIRCWSAATLEGGRLAVILQTDDTPSETLLLESTDDGETFPLKQKLPPSFGADEYCPLPATDGRALYILWPRVDKSLHFFRAAKGGTCS